MVPEQRDPELVVWEGPDDPEHPHNWALWRKLRVVVLLTLLTLVITIQSSIFGTGAEEFAREFHVSNEVTILGTSLFLVGFAVGPPFWAPISERYGRKWPMIIGVIICSFFTLMVPLGPNLGCVLAGRFLSGLFGNAPISIVGGAATDNWNAIDRGIALGVVIGVVFSGPMMGPIIGGFVTAHLHWKWNMWLMVIWGFAMALICAVFLEESYVPVALVHKAKRLRKKTGNPNLTCELEQAGFDFQRLVRVYLVRPWKLFATEPILVFVTIYQSFIYGIVYLFFTSIPIEFKSIRGWQPQLSELPLVALLIGVLIGSMINIFYTKRVLARQVAAARGSLIPEQRLPLMIVGGMMFPAGLFWFAWTSSPGVPWPAMVLAGLPTGTGMFLIWIQCFTYIIDVYLPFANSAIAINSLVRSLFGAGFPLFTPAMYHRLGFSWATSLLAFLGVAMIPVPIVFYRYGQKIRSWSKFSVKDI
ncbi:hypothetical protein EYZ11_008465 [Aspergillus tanneri]|uniref:Major facilitator superfamily (MFS) profile domain-containing protein n=1 Tax=Aspergillus tanneri TaxID=1220188 RepID=A0A4S3JCI8_9EURO|nr:uncharacterized protein ATNIH1004_005249 [Aspergillus tanneri]KAA8649348.1 hypothetical protein ATNIH1004_005249 [Aspergillus tanneri]THC92057.1 hypothetical protein EYZ11_008465 [Aspergillus tanneri]